MATLSCPACGHILTPQAYLCLRCGRRFRALSAPKRCPSCKAAHWDVPRGTLRRGRKPKPAVR